MMYFRNTILVVCLWPIPLMTAFTKIKECSPAEDGLPYMVKCGTTNQKSPMAWAIISASGKQEYISSACDDNRDASCNKTWADRITLTPRNDSKEGSLQLDIVSVKDDGLVISCMEVVESDLALSTDCTLRVYHKPENPVCQIDKTGENIVEMTCSTSKVFPGLACSFAIFEEHTKKVEMISDSRINYKSERAEDGYFKSNCYTVAASLTNGTYNFFPVLQPNTNKFAKKSSVAVNPVKSIHVLESPRKLLIYRDELLPTSENCRVQIPRIVFVCEARGFTVQPTLELLVGGVSASPMTTITTETIDGQIFRTVFKSNTHSAYRLDTDVMCLARTDDGLVSKLNKFDQLEEVKSKNRMLLDSSARHKLTCHGLNDSEDAKLKVTCFKNKQILLSSNALGANAEVVLHVGFDSTTCVCLNTDERECFSYETQFKTPVEEAHQDYLVHFAISATASACLLVVMILGGILLFRVSPRKGCGKGKREEYHNKTYQEVKQII